MTHKGEPSFQLCVVSYTQSLSPTSRAAFPQKLNPTERSPSSCDCSGIGRRHVREEKLSRLRKQHEELSLRAEAQLASLRPLARQTQRPEARVLESAQPSETEIERQLRTGEITPFAAAAAMAAGASSTTRLALSAAVAKQRPAPEPRSEDASEDGELKLELDAWGEKQRSAKQVLDEERRRRKDHLPAALNFDQVAARADRCFKARTVSRRPLREAGKARPTARGRGGDDNGDGCHKQATLLREKLRSRRSGKQPDPEQPPSKRRKSTSRGTSTVLRTSAAEGVAEPGAAVSLSLNSVAPVLEVPAAWTCASCTYANALGNEKCEMCMRRKPRASAVEATRSASAVLGAEADSDEDSASGYDEPAGSESEDEEGTDAEVASDELEGSSGGLSDSADSGSKNSRAQALGRAGSGGRQGSRRSTVARSHNSEDSASVEEDFGEDAVFDGGLRVPSKVWARLFPYQQTGLRWLWELHNQDSGGVIGDEMGLGKTIQARVSNLYSIGTASGYCAYRTQVGSTHIRVDSGVLGVLGCTAPVLGCNAPVYTRQE